MIPSVLLNDRPMPVFERTITYEDIRAEMNLRNYRPGLLTVVFYGGVRCRDRGTLRPGDAIEVTEGLRIIAVITDSA